MLYLAQVWRNDSLDQSQLHLLARQEAEYLWVVIPEDSFISIENTMSDKLLVLVEISPTGEVKKIQDAVNWVLDLVQTYLTAGITPEFLQQEAKQAEDRRQSLTLQNQDLARRTLELEDRREKLQALEEYLKREKKDLG